MADTGRRAGRQVVVTGAGVLCHMGDDLSTLEAMLRAGCNMPFARYPPAVELNGRCQIAGIYPGDLGDEDVGVTKAQGRFMGRQSRMALAATRRAMAQAGLATREFAVVVGSGAGDVRTHVEIQEKLIESKSMRRISPTVVPKLMASTASANLVNVLGSTGPSFTTAAACAGGAYNVLLASMLIESGHCDTAIAGGCEESDPHFHSGFDSMRAYNSEDNDRPERASRPYAADRAGFVFAEGAGIVVLEAREVAEARGAGVLGVVRGWGMSSDGEGDMVAPSSDGARRAIQKALEHAGLAPDDIDYVNTHGTSTPAGDVSEVRAIRDVLGGRHVAYSSTKGYTGHTVSAAGAIEAIFTLSMLRGGWIAPSVHASPLDPELVDYPPVLEPTARRLRHALSNSFGFGGTNVSLVLSAPDTLVYSGAEVQGRQPVREVDVGR
jgi:3-oxoacyl-[acyl-carrier-protein] synthase-1